MIITWCFLSDITYIYIYIYVFFTCWIACGSWTSQFNCQTNKRSHLNNTALVNRARKLAEVCWSIGWSMLKQSSQFRCIFWGSSFLQFFLAGWSVPTFWGCSGQESHMTRRRLVPTSRNQEEAGSTGGTSPTLPYFMFKNMPHSHIA